MVGVEEKLFRRKGCERLRPHWSDDFPLFFLFLRGVLSLAQPCSCTLGLALMPRNERHSFVRVGFSSTGDRGQRDSPLADSHLELSTRSFLAVGNTNLQDGGMLHRRVRRIAYYGRHRRTAPEQSLRRYRCIHRWGLCRIKREVQYWRRNAHQEFPYPYRRRTFQPTYLLIIYVPYCTVLGSWDTNFDCVLGYVFCPM